MISARELAERKVPEKAINSVDSQSAEKLPRIQQGYWIRFGLRIQRLRPEFRLRKDSRRRTWLQQSVQENTESTSLQDSCKIIYQSRSRRWSGDPLDHYGNNSPEDFQFDEEGLTQWRFSNAKAEAVDENIVKQAEVKSIHVWNALIKLQQSVLQKKLQLQKDKLEMKLDYIVHSQIKALEAWGNMERQHSSAVCSTTDYLHSVICRIPLVDGAKVEPQSASVVCHASDLATKINMMITTFQPTVEKTVGVVAELAMVVIQEKRLLEECLDLFKYVSALEIEERSLRGSIMQLKLLEQQQLEIMA
ncbi:hypothetical protein C2S51_036442 [Perilla frutescens var. frutescens]|nr:hypothetical protein C2S51_036442 [Perilla frutescens var. frutescens]